MGAELVTPDESLNYQEELNKVRISRVNSIASSEHDVDDRTQDFEVSVAEFNLSYLFLFIANFEFVKVLKF